MKKYYSNLEIESYLDQQIYTLKGSLKKVAGSRTQDPNHAISWVRLVIAYQYLFYENKVLAISLSMQFYYDYICLVRVTKIYLTIYLNFIFL